MFSSRSALASVSQVSLASVSLDSLDRVWPSRRSLMNIGSPYRSLNTALIAFESVSPKGGRISLTIPSPAMKLPSPISSVWGHIYRRRLYCFNLITKSYYEAANYKLNKYRGLNTQLYWQSYTTVLLTFWVRIARRRPYLIEPNNKVLYQLQWLAQWVCSVGWVLDYKMSWCSLPQAP